MKQKSAPWLESASYCASALALIAPMLQLPHPNSSNATVQSVPLLHDWSYFVATTIGHSVPPEPGDAD